MAFDIHEAVVQIRHAFLARARAKANELGVDKLESIPLVEYLDENKNISVDGRVFIELHPRRKNDKFIVNFCDLHDTRRFTYEKFDDYNEAVIASIAIFATLKTLGV